MVVVTTLGVMRDNNKVSLNQWELEVQKFEFEKQLQLQQLADQKEEREFQLMKIEKQREFELRKLELTMELEKIRASKYT